MVSEVYDALIEAGASQEKSRRAAEAVANYESRFNKLEQELVLIKWMLGLVLAGVIALILKGFFPG